MASAPGGRIHSPCGARGVGMKIALVTDAWMPQVNGVVTTLVELVRQLQQRGHEVLVIHPGLFRTRPCPGYAGIDLAVRPFKNWQSNWRNGALMPSTWPQKAPWVGPGASTAYATGFRSPRLSTPDSPKFCTPLCGFRLRGAMRYFDTFIARLQGLWFPHGRY